MTDVPNLPSIRVWLEPGYDHGRTGAWMLDWPGCFVWGPTRQGARVRVQSAVSRHIRWLVSHGETATAPATDDIEVVEEVAPAWLDDGYERNATFGEDRDPVSEADLATGIRRLVYARADLRTLVERVRAFGRDGGALPHHTLRTPRRAIRARGRSRCTSRPCYAAPRAMDDGTLDGRIMRPASAP